MQRDLSLFCSSPGRGTDHWRSSVSVLQGFIRRHWSTSAVVRLFLIFLTTATFVIGSWVGLTALPTHAASMLPANQALHVAQQAPQHSSLVNSNQPPLQKQALTKAPLTTPIPLTSVEGLSNHQLSVGEQPYHDYMKWQINDHLTVEVNVASGNLVVHASDLHISGTGVNLTIDRFYNPMATDSQVSGFGHHWNLSVGTDVYLHFNSDGSRTYYSPTGTPFIFLSNGSGGYVDPAGLNATLSKQSDGGYHLDFHKNGETYEFGSGGHLIADEDKNGNQITYNETSGKVNSLTDTQGRTTTFTYDSSGRLITLTDPSGRKVQYTYDSNGNLVSSTNALGQTTTYGYESGSDDLTQITDPSGHIIKIVYIDGVKDDQVGSLTDANGAVTTFSYSFDDNSNTTVVTDARGNKTTYTSDNSLRVTKVVDALGNTQSRSYTPDNNVSSITDPLGNTSNFTFDSNNNLAASTLASGAKTTFSYNDSDHPFYPTSSTDAQGHSLAYTYDDAGDLTQVKDTTDDGTGATTNYSYNANGTLASVTDANGNKTTYGYDSLGNLIQVTPPVPLGSSTLTPDALSRVTSLTDGKGQKTNFTYDTLDRITKVTYADGSSVSYVYDTAGNVTNMTDNTGTTTFQYDAANRVMQKTLPGGAVLKFAYDAVGNATSFTDAGGTVTYSYNTVNLLASETDPSGAQTTFGYDKKDQRTSVTYPNGVVMSMTYDKSGHETGVTAMHGATTLASYSYDYESTQVRQSMKDLVTGLETDYSYDSLNRLTQASITQISSDTQVDNFKYSYDKVGNRTSETLHLNGTPVTFTYNAANELTSTSQGTTYSYDANGNLTAINASSSNTTYTYNAKNQTISINGTLMTYTGTDQTERVQAGSTSFVNSPLGVSSQSSSSGTTYFTRDTKGMLISERTSSGTFYYLFDGLGSVVGLTDSSGNLVGNERYVYDPYGNVTNTVNSSQMQNNSWRFVSGYSDSFSGLTKFGIRYDDTTTGRWTQHTPIGGSLAETTKANPYVYANCNPVNLVDPSGALPLPCWLSLLINGAEIVQAIGGMATATLFGLPAAVAAYLSGSVTVGVGIVVGLLITFAYAAVMIFQAYELISAIQSIQQDCG